MSVDKDCPFCYAYAEFGDEHDARCPEVMASWDNEAWASFIEAIKNGLGWAENEGMSHDHPAVLTSLVKLIARYRWGL